MTEGKNFDELIENKKKAYERTLSYLKSERFDVETYKESVATDNAIREVFAETFSKSRDGYNMIDKMVKYKNSLSYKVYSDLLTKVKKSDFDLQVENRFMQAFANNGINVYEDGSLSFGDKAIVFSANEGEEIVDVTVGKKYKPYYGDDIPKNDNKQQNESVFVAKEEIGADAEMMEQLNTIVDAKKSFKRYIKLGKSGCRYR